MIYDDFKKLDISIFCNNVIKDNGGAIYIPSSHVNPNLNLKNQKRISLSFKAEDVLVLDVLGLHSTNKLKNGYGLVKCCKYGKK